MSNIALKTTIQDIENEYNLKVANIDKTLIPYSRCREKGYKKIL